MKTFTNASARDVRHAATLLRQARDAGKSAAVAGGGSDLLGMMKDRLIAPDVLVSLRGAKGADQIAHERSGVRIGGLVTLDALASDAAIRRLYPVLAEAAEQVATPQIRNVATLAGNICQRPWCWYYRNGFACYKNGGSTCFSASGENEFHAIFGGGPSYIVHPSDTAAALVALDASFRLVGPSGERTVPAGEFFVLPKDNVARENVLNEDEVLAAVTIPEPARFVRGTYHKIMDREAWTHAVVSAAIVLDLELPALPGRPREPRNESQTGQNTESAAAAQMASPETAVCRKARIVLGGVAPIPWRVPEAERVLTGQAVTPERIARAAEAAVAGARPLGKNAYKVPLTQAMVRRTLESLTTG